VIAKLATNTISWITLRARKLHLEFAALNIAADLLVMTGAVYLTGGPHSPLIPIYFIEVAIMALLTNVGLTVVVTAASFVLFTTMCVLIEIGSLPLHPTPWERVGAFSTPYAIAVIAAFAFTNLAPGAYVALIVQRLRRNEIELEARAREVLEASREKSQFMVNVTHELRTPLHGILGLSDLLRDGIYGPISEPQREALEGIDRSARGLLELIDGLLLLARAEAAKLEVTASDVDVAEVVQQIAAAGRWMCGRKALAIEVALGDGLAQVRTDRGKLAQILMNLVANAIKFTPEGGRVTLTARTGGAPCEVELAVADTGVGIPDEELARIFAPFHQVDGSASREFGGAGLGLSLVRRLCASIGATIDVQSAEGEGSTFTVKVASLPT
jgi:signal transduction histidine kinase